MTDREFFITEQCTFGVTNGHTKVGDIVLCSDDIGRPALIRKRVENDNYTFVGMSEVDGMMPHLEGNSTHYSRRSLPLIPWGRADQNHFYTSEIRIV